MKTMKKVLLILMVAVCIFAIIPQNVTLAATSATDALNGLENQAGSANVDVSGMQKIIANLLKFLQIASGLVAVLMIAIVGFNYIIGTPDVKNEMKTKMLPIIIGLILVFGAASIGRFILGAVGA